MIHAMFCMQQTTANISIGIYKVQDLRNITFKRPVKNNLKRSEIIVVENIIVLMSFI